MKGLFILFLLILHQGIIIGQNKTVKKKDIINPELKELSTKIEKLKSEPQSASIWANNLTNTPFISDSIMIYRYLKLAGEQNHWKKNAIQYLDSALTIAEKSGWKLGKGRALAQKGFYYYEKELYEIGNKTLFDAIPILKKYGTKKELLIALIVIQQIQWDFAGTEDLSLQTGQENLKLAEAIKDSFQIGVVIEHMAHAYLKKKQYEKAVDAFKKSHVWYGKSRNIISNIYLARALIGAKRFGEAKTYLKKMQVIDSIGSAFDRYYSHIILAEAYAEVGQFNNALSHNQIGNKVYDAGVHIMHDIEVFKNYYRIYKGLKHYDLAFDYLEKLRETEKKFSYNNLNKGFAEYQIRYESQEKQQQIDQLTIGQQAQNQKILLGGMLFLFCLVCYVFYNNLQLKGKNKQISTAMLQGQATERRRVAIDLHDNLGSTLSSIGWSMDAIDKSRMTKKELDVYLNLQKMIENAYSQVRLLSHNLLPEELDKQGLVVALQTFVRKLNKNTKTHFELQIPSNFNRLEKRTEFELYSIILELVNNILKHSHATHASIIFELKNQNLKLRITDNGKGLFENNSDGKGLKNVQARVASLKGKWEIKSKENEGTNSIIVVPI